MRPPAQATRYSWWQQRHQALVRLTSRQPSGGVVARARSTRHLQMVLAQVLLQGYAAILCACMHHSHILCITHMNPQPCELHVLGYLFFFLFYLFYLLLHLPS
jgi:hypothetical protein